MDPTVPAGAAVLLDFIYRTDAGAPPPDCYEIIFGNRQDRLDKPITSMTPGELIDAQAGWGSKAWVEKHWGYRTASSAAGAPQLMRATLIGLAKELHLRGDQVFEPDLQDRLAYHLLKRRGYAEFMAGEIDTVEFGKRLAMEWASMPVLSACRGAKRSLVRGQSYYDGDALNRALVSPERFAAVIRKAYEAEHAPAPAREDPAPGAAPRPSTSVPVAVGKDHAIAAAIGAAVTAIAIAAATFAGDVWHSIIGALS